MKFGNKIIKVEKLTLHQAMEVAFILKPYYGIFSSEKDSIPKMTEFMIEANKNNPYDVIRLLSIFSGLTLDQIADASPHAFETMALLSEAFLLNKISDIIGMAYILRISEESWA